MTLWHWICSILSKPPVATPTVTGCDLQKGRHGGVQECNGLLDPLAASCFNGSARAAGRLNNRPIRAD